MPNDRNKNFKYERIPLEDINKLLQLFNNRFESFLKLKGFPENIEYHIASFS